MDAELAPFEAFYSSPLQHPILLWLAAVGATALCAARRGLDPTVRRYCIALGLLSALDAWLTSNHIYGVGSLPDSLAAAVPLLFVLLGDYRYLLLVTAGTREGTLEPNARRLMTAAGLCLIVPVFSQAALLVQPGGPADSRVTFLIYEVGFLCLTGALLRWHPSARDTPWIRSVSRFVAVYYGLWAAADTLILLTGSDLGFLLRVVPNLLYYGGLIAVIGAFAPDPVRERPDPVS
jgi:hypothetical protein